MTNAALDHKRIDALMMILSTTRAHAPRPRDGSSCRRARRVPFRDRARSARNSRVRVANCAIRCQLRCFIATRPVGTLVESGVFRHPLEQNAERLRADITTSQGECVVRIAKRARLLPLIRRSVQSDSFALQLLCSTHDQISPAKVSGVSAVRTRCEGTALSSVVSNLSSIVRSRRGACRALPFQGAPRERGRANLS